MRYFLLTGRLPFFLFFSHQWFQGEGEIEGEKKKKKKGEIFSAVTSPPDFLYSGRSLFLAGAFVRTGCQVLSSVTFPRELA